MSGQDLDRALLEAETAYICDPERRPVDYWHLELLRSLQPIAETQKYAAEQKWAERRQSFWRGVQAAWLRQKQVSLLRSREEELTEALELRSQIYHMIKPREVDGVSVFTVQPRSLEGLMGAYCKLDQMIESKRDAVLGVIGPALGRADAEAEGASERKRLPFSADEMRKLAHSLLESRRKKRLETYRTGRDEQNTVSGSG